LKRRLIVLIPSIEKKESRHSANRGGLGCFGIRPLFLPPRNRLEGAASNTGKGELWREAIALSAKPTTEAAVSRVLLPCCFR
jgi:hypothetical protein